VKQKYYVMLNIVLHNAEGFNLRLNHGVMPNATIKPTSFLQIQQALFY